MRFFSVALGFLAIKSAYGLKAPVDKRQTSVDSFITTETSLAKAGLLANIGANGAKDQGAKAGVVVASPSTTNPNYVYMWIRDSSLVFKYLIDEYTSGRDTTQLPLIQSFVASQARIQQLTNPSGTVSTGGLGEPKFNIDETAFTDSWGRPQRDGPALRATALITLANYMRAAGQTTYVTGTLWPIIKLDLDYVSTNWNFTTFDLWEEVSGSSFFTTAVQHRSLRMGATFATAMGDTTRSSTYTTQAANVLCFQQTYWNPSGAYITSNTNVNNGRSGLDINSVLTSIHTFDTEAGCDALTFQPCSDKALANLYAVVNSFRGTLYSINSGVAANAAVAIGRYKEDVYFGGNPWYLATLAPAEQLYDALYQWNKLGSIPVTSVSLPFFKQFLSTAAVGSYASTSTEYATITAAVKTFADGFVAIVQKYIGTNGALAEQFSKSNGTPLSAADLTWSYASALTAFNARANKMPASWGAKGLTLACPATVTVTFAETATTVFGENIFLTGSIPALSNWSPGSAVALSAATYPVWKATVDIPANTAFQYKYIRKAADGTITWESDPNRSYTTGASGSITLNDSWR